MGAWLLCGRRGRQVRPTGLSRAAACRRRAPTGDPHREPAGADVPPGVRQTFDQETGLPPGSAGSRPSPAIPTSTSRCCAPLSWTRSTPTPRCTASPTGSAATTSTAGSTPPRPRRTSPRSVRPEPPPSDHRTEGARLPGLSSDHEDFRADATAALDQALASVRDASEGIEVVATVTEGRPVPVLLAAAAGAELLVVGSRGHGGFAGMLLGSVSQHCVQHAACPVVVIRTTGVAVGRGEE